MNWQSNDKIKNMRKEARAYLDKAQAILEKPGVTNADVAVAERYQKKASEIVDRAEKLMDVLEASGEMDFKGNGKGVGMETKERLDDHGFKDFGEFLKAVKDCDSGHRDSRLVKNTKDMAEGAGESGGYLVPPKHQAEVFALDAEQSIVEPRARIFEMTSRSLQIPALDQTGSTAGKPNFFSAMEMEWTEEAGSKPSTEPTLKEIELVPHKLAGYARVSDELLEDSSPSISAFLADQFSGCMNWWKDRAYLQGDGVGKPLGIVGAPGTFTQVRVLANNFGYVDATNMILHFHGKSAVWIMHKTVIAQLLTMVDPNGNYIWLPGSSGTGAGGVAGPMRSTLLGWPVLFTENVPTLGTTGDVLLCDLSKYFIGMRKGVTIETSTHERFRYDQTCFRVHARVDGQEANQQPVYLADGATQVSPFVELDAATP